MLLDVYQIIAGVYESILQNLQPFPHTRLPWIDSIRSYMKKSELIITLLLQINLLYKRINNQFIMTIVMDSKKYSPQETQDINNVRLFLQVLTLADISSHAGRYILDQFLFKNKALPASFKSPYTWHKQVSPGEKSWALWRNALARECKTKKQIKDPLKQWLSTSMSPWTTFYSPSTNRVYQKHRTTFRLYSKSSGQYFPTYHPTRLSVYRLPRDHIPSPTLLNDKILTIQGFDPSISRKQSEQQQVSSWTSYIKAQSPDIQQFFTNIFIQPNNLPFDTLLQLCLQLKLGTDGGVYNGKGYYVWTLFSDKQVLAYKIGSINTNVLMISSLHPEHYAIITALAFLYHRSCYFNFTIMLLYTKSQTQQKYYATKTYFSPTQSYLQTQLFRQTTTTHYRSSNY